MTEAQTQVEAGVEIPERPGVFRIVLRGRIYAPLAPGLEEQILRTVERGAKRILLVCNELEQVDSAALSAVIAGLKGLRVRGGGQIVFVAVNAHIQRVLGLTKMDRYFPVIGTEEEDRPPPAAAPV